MKRHFFPLLILPGLLCLMCASSFAQDTGEPEIPPKLVNPPNMVDLLHQFNSAKEWRAAKAKNRIKVNNGGRLLLNDTRTESWPRSGRWESRVIKTEIPFTELVPSWLPNAPEETGMNYYFRTRDAETNEWSPWLYLGQWGRTVHWPARTLEFDHGEVKVDYLHLARPANAFQARINLYSWRLDNSGGEAMLPSVDSLSVAYSGVVKDEKLRAKFHPTRELVKKDWAKMLDVPFRAQRYTDPRVKSSTCSPTSVTMVLSYWDIHHDPLHSAMKMWDDEYAIFGNWGRAIAWAGQNDLSGVLWRFRDWDDVKAVVAQDVPVIASIRFDNDTFPSNVMRGTNGHLIVIRGFTVEGDPIINDPASPRRGEAIVYKAEELADAWFEKGGVGYVIYDPDKVGDLL